MKPDYKDPTVPPLLYCDPCKAQREWHMRGGQFFCSTCGTRNGAKAPRVAPRAVKRARKAGR